MVIIMNGSGRKLLSTTTHLLQENVEEQPCKILPVDMWNISPGTNTESKLNIGNIKCAGHQKRDSFNIVFSP